MTTLTKPQAAVLLIVLSLLIGMIPSAAFASETPVHISVEAAVLDVTVSPSITLSNPNESVDLTVTPLTVQNNAGLGSIEVTKIAVTPATGWTLAPAGSRFDVMAADSKKFSLEYADHDFTNGEFAAADIKAVPGETATLQFSAKTCASTIDISSQQIATVVLTIGMVQVSL